MSSFLRTHLGKPGKNLADWGTSGLKASFMEGWKRDLGFFKTASGKHKFLGGKAGLTSLMGLGIGAGVGAAVYKATDNPLLGIGAGAGAVWATSGLKAAGSMGLNLLGPAFVAGSMFSGYQKSGVTGAVWGGTKSYLEMRLFGAGIQAVSAAFGGTSIAGAATGVGTIMSAVALPLAVVSGIGYGAYKTGQYFSKRGRMAIKSEFTGDTTAFETGAAYTMRQRAMQEISRSHTNSRTILGNEASLMHM